MTAFPLLTKISQGTEQFSIGDSSPELAIEVQTLLKAKGLYIGDIDGIPGTGTVKAFAEFKDSIWLAHADLLGATTAASLLEIAVTHRVSEQGEPKPEIDRRLSMRLPTGRQVYNTDLILPGGNLTWGEITHNCKRIPADNTIEGNLLIVARGFQEIRDRYSSPLNVNSGYRPVSVNRAIGGAKYSQHVNGLAIDLSPADGDLNRLLNVIIHSKAVGVGDGRKRGFIHCDWRKQSPRVVFDY